MKKLALLLLSVLVISSFAPIAFAAKPSIGTITKGDIFYSAGHYLAGTPIPTGFDPYGYNYQGHLFSGSYFNVYAGGAGFPPYNGDAETYLEENPTAANHWAWPYRDETLIMKWNDAWLSNKDRDGDGKLDRHYGYPSYIGSGAWETNHQFGTNEDGSKWNYFCKIVAVPADATKSDGYWYDADGNVIGSVIWGEFAVIQEVYNDHSYGYNGLLYLSEVSAGLGSYKP
ncbi:MAG: hypothetical protein IAX22_05285 [Candidatus Bathyarchaeota archaeon]|nr:hypothetical protein [Candidatus Bathyarchaeota archaeon]